MLLLFHFFFLAMNLSTIKSNPRLSHAQLSPGDLEIQENPLKTSEKKKSQFYIYILHDVAYKSLRSQALNWVGDFFFPT